MSGATGSFGAGNTDALNPSSPVGQLVHGMMRPVYPLPDEARRDGKELLKDKGCRWCGGLHVRACPRVKKMTFHTDGSTVLEVEFWAESEWSDANVVWPEDLEEAGDDE